MKRELKAAGLNKKQVEYALVLMRMGRTLVQAIEEAKELE